MDFEQMLPYLEFLNTWLDRDRFPTHETNESKVRADLQCLHDETQQYINTQLIPALVNILDQKASKEALNNLVAGQVPDNSVTAQHLAPAVREQLNAAATQTAVDAGMNDRYTKSESLSAASKTAFGLGSTATPANVFDLLSKYAQHCWMKRKPVEYTITEAAAPTRICLSYTVFPNQHGSGATFWRGTEIAVDDSGSLYIVDKAATTSRYSNGSDGIYAGEYLTFQESSGNPSLPAGLIYHVDGYGLHNRVIAAEDDRYETYVNAYLVTVQPAAETAEYVFSNDRSAHLDDGEQDGYRYTYLGKPLDKTNVGMRWQIGAYAGTGLSGADHPNSVTLDFVPQAVLFVPDSTQQVWAYLNGYAPKSMFTRDGMTLRWHAGTAEKQLNAAGVTYGYIAFG